MLSIPILSRKAISFVSLLFILLLLSACAGSGNKSLFSLFSKGQSSANSPITSPQDPRSFRYLSLSNQMRVLLIQDPAAEKAAASLDINIGSRQDPENRQGLAHFLEHMLFLGTEKYPDADEYQSFISEHGGSHNAYTSFEHTNYFFDIANKDLAVALDRFAEFFISPRFDQQYVEREMNAVESEYRARYKDEGRRVIDATKMLVNQEHPWRKFTVGSLQTLSGPSIRSDLLDFYQRYYSAEHMTLAVVGNYSLDELEQLVKHRFEPVPNRQREEVYLPIVEPLFSTEQTEAKILSVHSEKALRQLRFTFPVPDIQLDYRYKPLNFIGHLLGHEGKGSLLSALKAKGLAQSLSAGVGLRYQGGATFQMDLALTEAGLNQVELVTEHVFEAVGFLQQQIDSDANAMARLYQEQSQLASMAFYFFEKPDPVSAVVGASSALHFYPPEEVISGDYRFREFKPVLIRQRLNALTLDNALISIISDQLPERYKPTQVSQWFAAPYGVYEAPSEWQVQWASYSQAQADGNALFSLPEANQFIPTNFNLVDIDSTANVTGVISVDEGPRLVAEQKGARLWHQTDQQFRVPKVAVYLAMLTNRPNRNAREQALAALYVAVVNEQLNEYLYPAYLTGMKFSFYSHVRGFSLKIGGYNDSIEPMLKRFVEASTALTIDQQRFDNLKIELKRSLQRSMQAAPYQRLSAKLSTIVYQQDWTEKDIIKSLGKLNLTDVERYFETIHQSTYFDALTHGNINEVTALGWFKQLVDVAHCECDMLSDTYVNVALLPRGSQYWYVQDVDHSDAAVRWYLQASDDHLKTSALSSLTAAIMHPAFFNSLRTEQQLGYIVGVRNQPAHRWPGMALLVQSPTASEQQLIVAMNEFIDRFISDPVSEQTFSQHRDALVVQLREADTNLSERSARYWFSLATNDEAFTRSEDMARHIEELDYEAWIAYITKFFGADQASLIMTTDTQPLDLNVLPGMKRWSTVSAPTSKAYR